MKVSELVTQYQNNLSSGSEVSTKTKGIEQLVETVKQLQKGCIFEGTINSIRGTQVILGLSSGQNITARLDAGLSLTKGQSVFFQVKSNDGEQIRIKPISTGAGHGNPTLMKALDAAGLVINESNLNMVDAMMREKMSIDSKSLSNMARLIGQINGGTPESIVQMQKFQIPVTEVSVAQFENYKGDRREILSLVKDLTGVLPEVITEDATDGGTMIARNDEFLRFFTENAPIENVQNFESSAEASPLSGSVGEMLGPGNRQQLEQILKQLPQIRQECPELFQAEGGLKEELETGMLLKQLNTYLTHHGTELPSDLVRELFQNKGYRQLFQEQAIKNFTLEPKNLTEEHSVSDLYEKMEQQLQQLQHMTDKYPKARELVQTASTNLSQNIEFMNQLNQFYSYVQIPVRLRGQNVNSELFVYRNRKDAKEENEELTAFLHFDMTSLGNVDISVKLVKKNVSANWYLEDENSLFLLSENIHLLTQRLEQKGYHCQMDFTKEEQKIDFVEDFLKADQKTGGEVHRYSFDVRA